MSKNEVIDPKVYYQNLRKKDKAKFLHYLSLRYDYKATTMSGKLRENPASSLRRDEYENLVATIKTGAWK